MPSEFNVLEKLTGSIVGQTEPTSRVTQSIAFVNAKCSPELIYIRLLLGSVNIEHQYTSDSWDQEINFSVWTQVQSNLKTRRNLISLLKGIGIERKVLDSHLRRNLKQSAFYEELCGEILNALHHQRLDQHTLSFIHIYRLLERVSFAFPLLFAAKSKDFKKSYTDLKDFIEGGADKGELSFFRKFVESSIDQDLLEGKARFDFEMLPQRYRGDCYRAVKRFLTANDITDDVQDQLLEVNNVAILPLLITLRNRFFHFASSHGNNLSSIDVPNSDHLFAVVNRVFLNWISVIYFEILRHMLAKR